MSFVVIMIRHGRARPASSDERWLGVGPFIFQVVQEHKLHETQDMKSNSEQQPKTIQMREQESKTVFEAGFRRLIRVYLVVCSSHSQPKTSAKSPKYQ